MIEIFLMKRSFISLKMIVLAVVVGGVLVIARGKLYISLAFENAGILAFNQSCAALPPSNALMFSEKLLHTAVSVLPSNHSAWRIIGYVYSAQGEKDTARVAWQVANGMIEEFILFGERARNAGHNDIALKWYEKGESYEPNLGDWYYYRALIYESMDRWDEAIILYQQSSLLPLNSVKISDIFYHIGWLKFRKIAPPNLTAALIAFDKAIDYNQFSKKLLEIQTHHQRGEVLRRLGRNQEALIEFEKVIAQEPDNYQYLTNYGSLLWEVKKDTKRAEDAFLLAIQLNPDSKWAYRGLGQIYQQTNRIDEAYEMYKKTLMLDPYDFFAREQIDMLTNLNKDDN